MATTPWEDSSLREGPWICEDQSIGNYEKAFVCRKEQSLGLCRDHWQPHGACMCVQSRAPARNLRRAVGRACCLRTTLGSSKTTKLVE